MNDGRLALYTTVYPGVEKYLRDWYDSVVNQTDKGFDLWIGVDGLTSGEVMEAMGAKPSATWIMARAKDTPAGIRHRAIEQMSANYYAVVFVDADDLLDPSRVEAARKALLDCDVNACAMCLIDEKGRGLEITFAPLEEMDLADVLPRRNLFGLSNTAYRSSLLMKCLPIPRETELVDWFLAVRAWASGARMTFDRICRMAYRQHANNIARVLPPFPAQQILRSAELVIRHYGLLLENAPELDGKKRSLLERLREEASLFHRVLGGSREKQENYALALNSLPPDPLWWACVAHPKLESLWKT